MWILIVLYTELFVNIFRGIIDVTHPFHKSFSFSESFKFKGNREIKFICSIYKSVAMGAREKGHINCVFVCT